MDASLIHAIYWLLLTFTILFSCFCILCLKWDEKGLFSNLQTMILVLMVLLGIGSVFAWLSLSVILGILLYMSGYALWLCIVLALCNIAALPCVLYILAWVTGTLMSAVAWLYRAAQYQIQKASKNRQQKNEKK